MSDANNDDKTAQIEAIKARLAKMKSGGGDAPAADAGQAAPPAAAAGGGDAPAPGDKAALMAQIKARLAGGAAAAPAAGGAAPAAGAAPDGGAAGGEDMAARIAALKAKVDATKGQTAPAAKKSAEAKKAGAAKNVYPVAPINRKTFGEESLYEPNTVNKWFILGGILLTVAVLGMWRRDHVRNWKPYQQEARLLDILRLEQKIGEAEEAIDPARQAEFEAEIAALEQSLAAKQDVLDDLMEERGERDGEYYAANQAYQILKSEMDAYRFAFEEQRLMHGDDEDLMRDADEELASRQTALEEALATADRANLALTDVDDRIKAVRADLTEATRGLTALTDSRDRLLGSLKKIEPSLFNDLIRNAPVADMLAPTVKVEKIVLDKLRDNYNFMHVGKVDMCITCHTTINDPYFSDWDDENVRPWHAIQGGEVVEDDSRTGQRVFNAHPRLDLFVGDNSPHPMGEFGCTTCHLGRGQAIEFERTFHTPTADAYETADEKQARWVEDYGYDPGRHYWDWPMTPSDKLYSSCFMCHSETDRIPGVPEYNESRALIEDLGCYGCHKIDGLQHLRKPGPDLTRVAAKVSPEWARKWSLSPQGFRPTTRMPHFWHQSNTGAPAESTIDPDREWFNNSDRYVADWRHRNEIEARAVVAYVYSQSQQAIAEEGYELQPVPEFEGDAEAGRATFEQRGCLGCHAMSDEGWEENWHGPELSRVGSKLAGEQGERWLFNWLLNPKQYYPTTVMPDLRLTDKEAWDITAYLVSKRDQDWEAMPDAVTDDAVLDSIAVENLASIAGEEWALDRVASMRAEGGGQAVEVFVGEKLFNRFGCSGCHLVPGHYDDVGIGTELTYEALKELTKFDFGHEAAHGNPEAIGHGLPDWFNAKLTDPRVFDRLPVVAEDEDGEKYVSHYEQKVKLPFEKLKMPNYYLDQDEVDLVVQFLLGTRDDGIDTTMKQHLDADEALVEQGSRLITKYNCIGCHRMGQLPERVRIGGEDLEEQLASLETFIEDALDYGVWAARPVTTGDTTLFPEGAWISDEFYSHELEETADIYEFLEDEAEGHPVPAEMFVYGSAEGGMGRYIDQPAMRPPVLRGEGGKVNPDWLFEFLLEPYVVRTHVNVRMPNFGMTNGDSLALVRWFAAQTGEAWPFEVDTDTELDEDLYASGEDLFANALQCNKCHPAGDQLPGDPDPTNWGPDLSMAKARLKLDWIGDWLKDPQGIQPGTKMPSFFGEYSDGEYESYYDDYEERIAALVHYMKHLRVDDGSGGTAGGGGGH